MELIYNLGLGFATALTPANLLYCFIGAFLGTIIGILPGVGPITTIALLLPISFSLDPTASLIMLAGIYYGASYGGSTTAILMNLPGEASSAVTAIDGYEMARQGRAGPALAIAAIGSFIAGSVVTLLIALFGPPLTELALSFKSPDFFSLIVLGLISSVAIARGNIFKALAMVVLGLLLGSVGTDLYTGTQRFTFGVLQLFDGVNIVSLAVGLFGIAEILRNLEGSIHQSSLTFMKPSGGLMPTVADIKASGGAIARGTALGAFLGVLPGGGATLSAFVSYALEKKLSRTPERFGRGAIEGVAGPESANNAGAQGSFIPMLTLGIPSNPVMALMIGALVIQGITPGPNVMNDHPTLFWGLIASMWIGNLMLLFLNLPLVGLWVKLLAIPYDVMFPAVIAFSSIGVLATSGSVIDVVAIGIFGLAGHLLIKLGFEPAPLLLGFVLGPMFEENFRRSMLISLGDPMTFITHPISAGILSVAGIILIVACLPGVSQTRDEVFKDE